VAATRTVTIQTGAAAISYTGQALEVFSQLPYGDGAGTVYDDGTSIYEDE